jgi:tetratricopeptide (TPR) repeat protein
MSAGSLRTLLAIAVCALLLPRPLQAAGAWDRNGFDADDLARLNLRDSALGAEFLRGEAELRSGANEAAAVSFKHVLQQAPDSALAGRRYCQALTELAERQAAVAACEAALRLHPTAPSFRATVRALMLPTPTPEELDVAAQLANAAQLRMGDQPWGLAARSDIAERTGDEKMLEMLVVELERIAPGHYETLRARRALNGFRLPAWAWSVWLGLAALLVGTGVHAAFGALSRLRARRRLSGLAASATLILCALLGSRSASADASPSAASSGAAAPAAAPEPGGLSKWPVDDADPKKSLPTPVQRDGNPLEFGYHLMDLADKADIAKRKGDYGAVAKYYEAMAVAVPDRAIGYRKSCEAYEKTANPAKALDMCRGALGAQGVELADYQHFAQLVFGKEGALTPADVADLSDISSHLKGEPGALAAGLQIQCQLAQRLDDVLRLEECAAAVAKETPNDPKLVIYRWGIAMKQEDYKQAEQLVESARKSALRPAGIDMMAQMTQEQSAIGRRLARGLKRHALAVTVVFAVLLAVACGLWMRRRFRVHAA